MSGTFRVTQRSIADRALLGLQANLDRLGDIQEQLSSGRAINKPSDSPIGTVSALQLRGTIEQNAQWSRNASDGLGWLGTVDSSLTSIRSMTNRVRDLALQGLNTGASSPTAREALATEVDQIRDAMIGVANTTYMDRPIFGGTVTGQVAYDLAGNYVGDANPTSRTVGANDQVRIEFTGPEVFGTSPTNLFQILATISNDLRTNSPNLSTDLGVLDGASANLMNKATDIGARYQRVDQMRQAAEDRQMALKNTLSGIEDIDLPKTMMALQLQEVAYQSALGATAKTIQPSLMDFLR